MTDWRWWAGDNEERYSVGPCDTREEAIAEARGYDFDPIFVIEARERRVPYVTIDGAAMVETLCENYYDHHADPNINCDIFEATGVEVRQLGDMLTAAFHAWCRLNNISANSCAFEDTRNAECIEGA